MTIIFDGKAFAFKKEEEIKLRVDELKKKGINPKLSIILVGEDPGSILYVNLKRKAGERAGIKIDVRNWTLEVSKKELIEEINVLNNDKTVHGILVQLPLPSKFTKEGVSEILNAIDPKKDVDGLTNNSPFIPATVKAVEAILLEGEEALLHNNYPYKVLVVGSKGEVGKRLLKRLHELNGHVYNVKGVDMDTIDLKSETLNADILISVTGKPNLIKADMVKKGAVLIDVGSPKGDIEKAAYEKANFVSPVPGGVGPNTIIALLENLLSEL